MNLRREVVLKIVEEAGVSSLEALSRVVPALTQAIFSRYGWKRNPALSKTNIYISEVLPSIGRHQLCGMLAKLKAEGLLSGPNTKLKLTNKGKIYIDRLKGNPPVRIYPLFLKPNKTLVIFDIPEKMRSQRAWLRDQLRVMDYHALQMSVWIGSALIPAQFFEDANEARVLKFVHIFEISKEGTLN